MIYLVYTGPIDLSIGDVPFEAPEKNQFKAANGRVVSEVYEALFLVRNELAELSENEALRKSLNKGILKSLKDKGYLKELSAEEAHTYRQAQLAQSSASEAASITQKQQMPPIPPLEAEVPQGQLSLSPVTSVEVTGIQKDLKQLASTVNTLANIVAQMAESSSKKRTYKKKKKD